MPQSFAASGVTFTVLPVVPAIPSEPEPPLAALELLVPAEPTLLPDSPPEPGAGLFELLPQALLASATPSSTIADRAFEVVHATLVMMGSSHKQTREWLAFDFYASPAWPSSYEPLFGQQPEALFMVRGHPNPRARGSVLGPWAPQPADERTPSGAARVSRAVLDDTQALYTPSRARD